MNPYEYTITIRQIEDEGVRLFESTIAELPDAADYGDTYQEAYERSIMTIEGAEKLYKKLGKEFPKPHKPGQAHRL